MLVDEVKASRAALGWAMLNVVRRGDVITLLHVHSASAAAASASSATGRSVCAFSFSLSLQVPWGACPHCDQVHFPD